MADVSAEEKARRVRSLLSAYYTSGAEEAPGRAGGGRAAASIDSAAFDADAYIGTVVRALRPAQCHCGVLLRSARARVCRRARQPRNT
jgi:hypothetical protein